METLAGDDPTKWRHGGDIWVGGEGNIDRYPSIGPAAIRVNLAAVAAMVDDALRDLRICYIRPATTSQMAWG